MKKSAKKLFIYVSGIFILSIGVNISKAAQMGISPVSAIPYAIELIWNIELGKATLFFSIALIALQMVLLGKNFKLIQLLQLACIFLFSFFVTYTGSEHLLFWLPMPSFYITKLLYLFVSILIIGIGISFYLMTNYISLPAEGLMSAIVELSKGKWKFANVKVVIDSSMVVVSAILSMFFLGQLKSVREGTVISALLIGEVVGFMFKRYKPIVTKWIEK
ncbi:MAG: hypothetical protein GX289_03915 [Tissierellia bacterium]|nr:hypothetical protein [Tissierellia bacterium]